ncbi:ArsR/SmtB family transcription factor [Candidatus Xianfuyuplasma coldseepsis]|uniref:Winged helix-turn-helix transcriptional regulator n=1 Tax=Candidatus Xianfuyuplasma coldseepsis TaxID=2782163 RepID=A0A7L7KRL6_9MOLU|nr:metalloregulator ArsR/SmtB family transcription factor [Xianfuyuplasma coldseepsis]QMS84846.1 winged helix-turn-helix transcriptional regulator [Xianfuyuplasma coldseepsis]
MKSLTYLKSISNNTKLRLVSLLLENELCVCELEEITNIRQVNISKNLSSLKDANIVDVRRDKQRGFYFITDTFKENEHLINHIKDLRFAEPLLQQDYEEFLHHEDVKDDNIYVCRTYRNEAS